MSRRSARILPALCVLSLFFAACSKKPPVAPPREPVASAPRVDVPRAPDSTLDTTRDPSPLADKDLDRLNAHIQREGLLGDVYFGFDRYDLDATARQRLESNARFLAENPDLIVKVEGHCDERGTNEYNLALGSRRADTAVEVVRSLGVPGHRLKPISMGEEVPFCRESTESCWAQNRRARFLVVGRS